MCPLRNKRLVFAWKRDLCNFLYSQRHDDLEIFWCLSHILHQGAGPSILRIVEYPRGIVLMGKPCLVLWRPFIGSYSTVSTRPKRRCKILESQWKSKYWTGNQGRRCFARYWGWIGDIMWLQFLWLPRLVLGPDKELRGPRLFQTQDLDLKEWIK